MKILHVLYSGLGGHGSVFFSMVSADASKKNKYEALFFGIEDVRVDFIEQCEAAGVKWYFSKKHRKFDPQYYLRIYRFIRESNPDIIFLHGSAYILPAKAAAMSSNKTCRIVIRETQANHLKTKLQWLSLGTAMLLSDHIVCLTEEFRSQIKNRLSRFYRERKVTVIPNGLDLNMYKPVIIPAGRETVIGMQSRLVKIKDHLTLLKAFALLRQKETGAGDTLKLRIAGDGDFKTVLQRSAADLGIAEETEFCGMLPEGELVAFLQSLDIYVHASFGETMSTAIMQAMACKLPIVASDVPGIYNMISNNDTGLLVPAEDEHKLADAIQTLLNNKALAESLADHAHQFAINNYSNTLMLQRYNEIFTR